jgi:hypothetical protein
VDVSDAVVEAGGALVAPHGLLQAAAICAAGSGFACWQKGDGRSARYL